MLYRSLRETLNSKSVLLPQETNFLEFIKDNKKDYYISLYLYNEEQKKHVSDNDNKIAGIKDTVTNYLFWDFDSKDNLDQARQDSINLIEKLRNLGFDKDCIDIYFTGYKGFNVQLEFENKLLTPFQFKNLTIDLAKAYPTFDRRVNDPNRVIRLPNTLHQVTNLYKIQLNYKQLTELNITEIKELASKPQNIISFKKQKTVPQLLEMLLNKPEVKPQIQQIYEDNSVDGIDYTQNKTLTNCRWSLQHGNFKEGERNSALMCLAATYKNMGYKPEITYRMLKGVAELQAKRFNCTRYSDSEIHNNIVRTVYAPTWNNGQFSCRNRETWLGQYCESLKEHSCSSIKSNSAIVDLKDTLKKFKTYASSIDKNTIKSGIPELDAKMRLTIGEHIAILGAPSSGKTSLALQLLENTSMAGINSLFFCMDMSDITTVQKLYQKVSKKNSEDIYKMVNKNVDHLDQYNEYINERYSNVNFCFRNGLSIDHIRDIIIEEQKKQKGNLKLIVLDYAGRVLGPWSDMNANSAFVANGLRSIANELGLCVVTLVQPPKSAGDARDELFTLRQIKGSSVIEESIDRLFAVFRPGYNPMNDNQDDHFMVISVLKNRLGDLFCLNFKWDGLPGTISSIETTDEFDQLKALVKMNRERKRGDSGWND